MTLAEKVEAIIGNLEECVYLGAAEVPAQGVIDALKLALESE